MKRVSLWIAILALLLVALDFFSHTWPQLVLNREARHRVKQSLDQDATRLASRGTPPSAAELLEWREAVKASASSAATAREAFFAGAEQTSDYLFSRPARPNHANVARIREALEQRLLRLSLDLDRAPFRAESLGIRLLSVNSPLSTDPETMQDQLERCVVASWLVELQQGSPSCYFRRAQLTRDADEQTLQLELGAEGPIENLILLYERSLAPSGVAPPRRLVGANFQRIPPEEWNGAAPIAEVPPFELEVRVAFTRPESYRPRDLRE